MSSGGGGQTVSNEFKPPANTQPWWDQYVNTAGNLSQKPYTPSGIPSVAPWNDYDQFAATMAYDRAANGAPDINAARGAVTSIAGGGQQNPWQSFLAGTASGQGPANPFMANAQGMAAGESNPYMIDPEAMIKATAADMATAEQRGVGAQTDAAANRAGAYGGSANQLMQSQNATDLARATGTMAAGARQAAAAQNAQTWQQQQQNRLGAMGLGGGFFDSAQGRQIQAALGGGQMFNSDIGNILASAGLAGQLSNDDWVAINQMAGQGSKMGAYQQALLGSGQDEFQRQQMYPYTLNELLGGALSRASGGQGSSTTTGPGANPYWNAAGLALAGYGLTR